MKNTISNDLLNEINDLKNRARIINYKNVFPRFPKDQLSQKSFDNLMIGFEKRLHNWKNGLLQLENPGGMLNGKKRGEPENKSVEHIDYRQYVINSLEELEELSDSFN